MRQHGGTHIALQTSVMQIEGRVAVVTGAAIGIGPAIALGLTAAGADVVASDINEEGGMQTVARAGACALFQRI